MQFFDYCRRDRANYVGHSDHTEWRVISHDVHGGLAAFSEGVGPIDQLLRQRHPFTVKQGIIPDTNHAAHDVGTYPAARDRKQAGDIPFIDQAARKLPSPPARHKSVPSDRQHPAVFIKHSQ